VPTRSARLALACRQAREPGNLTVHRQLPSITYGEKKRDCRLNDAASRDKTTQAIQARCSAIIVSVFYPGWMGAIGKQKHACPIESANGLRSLEVFNFPKPADANQACQRGQHVTIPPSLAPGDHLIKHANLSNSTERNQIQFMR
jgi:hypothetical protein